MNEKPLLMTAENYRKTATGEKTMTRRVCRDDYVFSLTDSYVYGIYTGYSDMKGYSDGKCYIEKNTNSTKRQLQSRFGRIDLLTEKIWEFWRNGVRGMVSVKRVSRNKRILSYNDVSQEQENMPDGSQARLCGVSWDSTKEIITGETFGWNPKKQQAGKLKVGNSDRKLGGQEGARERVRGRKTSDGETHRRGMPTLEVGNQGWFVQPKSCRPCSGNVEFWNIGYCEAQIGQKRWIKEPFRISTTQGMSQEVHVRYKHDNCAKRVWLKTEEYERFLKWERPDLIKSSLFMFKSLARLWVEVTGVKVGRVQDISLEDIRKEGLIYPDDCNGSIMRNGFKILWDSINNKKYPWSSNPWVWAYTYKRIEK